HSSYLRGAPGFLPDIPGSELDLWVFLLGLPRLEPGSRSFLLGAPNPELGLPGFLPGAPSPELDLSGFLPGSPSSQLDLPGFLLGAPSPELGAATHGMLASAGRHHRWQAAWQSGSTAMRLDVRMVGQVCPVAWPAACRVALTMNRNSLSLCHAGLPVRQG